MSKIKNEFRVTLPLASILSIRMLGLFMILPVFSLYAPQLQGATPTLIGIALGIYGFTQACLQMPLGILSDKIGRKPIIAGGLIIFIIGSVLAASSMNIYSIMLGRALQGAGAIGSTISAFIADLVPAERRLKAMAALGMTIGTSFMLAMIMGPFLNTWIGLSGLFWLTAIMGVCGLFILTFAVPSGTRPHINAEANDHSVATLIFNKNLLPLDMAIFSLHAILTAVFVVLPMILKPLLGSSTLHQSLLYFIVLILSFLLMVPGIIFAERHRRVHSIVNGALLVLVLSLTLCVSFKTSLSGIGIALLIFFTAFNLLEASLPSLVAKIAPSSHRGTAMGIFSTWQFLGIFFGGTGGGLLLEYYGIDAVLIGCAILAAIGWLVWIGFFVRIPTNE